MPPCVVAQLYIVRTEENLQVRDVIYAIPSFHHFHTDRVWVAGNGFWSENVFQQETNDIRRDYL